VGVARSLSGAKPSVPQSVSRVLARGWHRGKGRPAVLIHPGRMMWAPAGPATLVKVTYDNAGRRRGTMVTHSTQNGGGEHD